MPSLLPSFCGTARYANILNCNCFLFCKLGPAVLKKHAANVHCGCCSRHELNGCSAHPAPPSGSEVLIIIDSAYTLFVPLTTRRIVRFTLKGVGFELLLTMDSTSLVKVGGVGGVAQ